MVGRRWSMETRADSQTGALAAASGRLSMSASLAKSSNVEREPHAAGRTKHPMMVRICPREFRLRLQPIKGSPFQLCRGCALENARTLAKQPRQTRSARIDE